MIHGCHSKSAKEKIFAKHPDTTPDFDLRLLLAEEKSRTGIKQLITAGQSRVQPEVGAVRNNQGAYQRKFKKKTSQSEEGHRLSSNGKCISCGRMGHRSSRSCATCQAKDKECRACKKKGHFDTICWQAHPELKPNGIGYLTIGSSVEKHSKDVIFEGPAGRRHQSSHRIQSGLWK